MTTEDDDLPRRPTPLLIGCIMAWLGSIVLLYSGLRTFRISASSSLFSDVAAKDLHKEVTLTHHIGLISIGWGLVLAVATALAFAGTRWAATVMAAMGAMVAVLLIWSLFSGFVAAAFFVTSWSVLSVTLVRFIEPSKQWYASQQQRSFIPWTWLPRGRR